MDVASLHIDLWQATWGGLIANDGCKLNIQSCSVTKAFGAPVITGHVAAFLDIHFKKIIARPLL